MVDFNPGALSRVVPAHKLTMRFNWCKRDFMLFGTFKAARDRSRMSMGIFDKCFWCKAPFAPEDMMALAQPEHGGNKTLCQTCAGQISAPRTGADP